MTLTTLPPAAPVLRRAPSRRLAQRFADVIVLTGRNLVHIAREPLQLSDVTIQPVLFTLLFVYVFGSGVVLPGGSYTDFAIAGLLALNLTTSAMGTAVGLSNDLNSGVIDRFRTLPMWRAAVLVGRSLADLSTAALCALIVALTGLLSRSPASSSAGGPTPASRRSSAGSPSSCSSPMPCPGAAAASAS
jgi:ABC-2 type transport system permease protein